jgi:hypothetical protein
VEAVLKGSSFNVAVYDRDASGGDPQKVLSLQVAGGISELSNNPIPIYVPPALTLPGAVQCDRMQSRLLMQA